MSGAKNGPSADLIDMADADLLRLCGRHRHDKPAWREFFSRYEKRIFLYVLRAARRSPQARTSLNEQLQDLAQEVYLRLVKNDAHILRTFRGSSDFAVRAFLARIAFSVVQDCLRYHEAGPRRAEVISIDQRRELSGGEERLRDDRTTPSADQLLSRIDLERALIRNDTGSTATRNLLIFKLHYVDGFTAREIAAFPGFCLSVSGIEAVLNRTRAKLRS